MTGAPSHHCVLSNSDVCDASLYGFQREQLGWHSIQRGLALVFCAAHFLKGRVKRGITEYICKYNVRSMHI